MRAFERDFRQFLGSWIKYSYLQLYGVFARFEKVKRWVAHILYRQRGRFARPFMHTAMGGIVALGVTLAPVLASSFPGVSDQPGDNTVPEQSVMQVNDDQTTATVVSDKVRDKILEYSVQSGDTVSAIAAKFGVSVDTIRWENSLASLGSIKPGDKLNVLPVTGVRHKVSRGETVYSIAKKYGTNAQGIVDFPFNTFADNETFALTVGQDLIVPDGEKPNVVLWSPSTYIAKLTPDAGAVSATGQFVWPIGGTITQRFSWYHRGVDIATAFGAPVLAADSGTVIVAGWPDNSGYGNRIVIDHGNGTQTWYGHLSAFAVKVGQRVNRGDRIGSEGSTGRSTGPHLHFEIRRNGVHLNPLDYLK